jgi:hypothetical protein
MRPSESFYYRYVSEETCSQFIEKVIIAYFQTIFLLDPPLIIPVSYRATLLAIGVIKNASSVKVNIVSGLLLRLGKEEETEKPILIHGNTSECRSY